MSSRAATGRSLPQDGAKPCVNSVSALFTQVELPLTSGTEAETRWQTLLKLIREVVDEIGAKQVAFDLDTSPSQLSNALAERDRHSLPGRWLVYFASKSDRVVKFFAAARGFDIAPRKIETPEEKLQKLKDSVKKNLGPALQDAVLRDAFGDEL